MLALFAAPLSAHDIPGEMRMHAFVKQEGERLRVLVRVPLALLLNLDLPKKGPGYLDLAYIDEHLPRAVAAVDTDLEFHSGGRPLELLQGRGRISQPSDRSFETYDQALAHILGSGLPPSALVFWNQGYFDALLEYRLGAGEPGLFVDFHVAPGLRDRLKLDLRYLTPAGTMRAFLIETGQGEIALDPRWHQAFWSFTKAGFEHILDGPDHLLFLLCLVLPFRRLDWRLVGVVTAFTVAHSVTLIAAAYGLVPSGAWFPPLVETLIALSILYAALENVLRPRTERRWLMSGAFGLIHGFGFSFLLSSQLQFAGSHLLLSLVAFNVGIELGQMLVLVLGFPILTLLYRSLPGRERLVVVVLSVVVGHAAWHWLTERAEALQKADWSSLPDASSVALTVMIVSLVAGGGWLAWRSLRRARSFTKTA